MKTKLLVTLYNQPQAHIFKTFLESKDISVFLFNENFSVIEGGISLAGIKIHVLEEDYDKAVKYGEEFAQNQNEDHEE